MDLAGEGKMMPAVALLDAAYEAGEFDAHSLAQFHSLVGDEAGALALFDSDAEPGDGAVDLSGYSAVPAIEAILEAAKDRRVVMINEAHHVSRHRAFGHLLMAELRKVGFTHLAAETFCNGCDSLTQDGAPVRTTGFYTRDPVYGDFVRQALSLGYGLVPYEQTPQQNSAFDQPSNVFIALREHAQAANLKAFLDANPDARLLVFVGHGHHAEMGMGEEGEDLLMGARFARMSGIDPLTINQEFGTPRSSPQFDAPIYRGARAIAGSPEQPFVVRGEDGSMVADAGFDVTLFHPRVPAISGRPGWLSMNGYRVPEVIPLEPMQTRTLVRAFVAGEPEDAIPMDQAIAPAGVREITLMLPEGEYRLVRQTETGEDIPLGELTSPPS